jgi:TPR repeat protein
MYENGHGTEIDNMKAYEWYMRAAEQGYEDAQFNLGVYYLFLSLCAGDSFLYLSYFCIYIPFFFVCAFSYLCSKYVLQRGSDNVRDRRMYTELSKST